MVNLSKGEQLYYLVLLTKLNSYGSYRGLNISMLYYIFLGIVPTKSPFSQKVLRKYEQKICHKS